MIIISPAKMPADAKLITARPIMKATEVGAAPHRAEPASKMTREIT